MLVESLEQRRMLSATITQVGDTLTINYSSDTSGNTLNVYEGKAIEQSPVTTDASNAVPGTVQVFDDLSGLRTPIDDGSHPDGIYTGVSHIIINGGKGNDNINFFGSDIGAQINGNAGDDVISVIDGYTGTADTGAGASTVHGGDGNDTIILNGGNGTNVYGDNNNDRVEIDAPATIDFVDAGNGSDTVVLNATLENSTILGGNGSDTIIVSASGTGSNTISGGNGSNTITFG